MTAASLARPVRYTGPDSPYSFAPQPRDFDEPPDIPARSHVNLTKLEAELSRSPLDEIALLVKALTYGEMMELGEALWKVKGESEVTQDALPGILHQWATARGAK